MALAVTCLLSLIPMKVPAMNPFWHQEAFTAYATSMADTDDALAKRVVAPRRSTRLGSRDTEQLLAALDPLTSSPPGRSFESKLRAAQVHGLYAGIRANPRIPAKRVRQIALPPPTPFNLRAPPACA